MTGPLFCELALSEGVYLPRPGLLPHRSAARRTAPIRSMVMAPQLDGRPSWDPTPTLLIAGRGTRARSSVRRHRSSSRASGRFAFACRWKAGYASSPHLGTLQYARILEGWVEELGLDPADYGTHSMRRTKATLIYRRTKNLRAVQLLLDHSKLESTVRYLGIEVDDASEIAEQTEI